MNESNIEIACRDLVFHFNKGFLQDPTIPMWVVKTKGKTYYVEHVDANVPWSTKETADNSHTKGSLKFKNCLCTIDSDNCVTLTVLTPEDKERLSYQDKAPIRIISIGSNINPMLRDCGIEAKVLEMSGACTSPKWIVEVTDAEATFLLLKYPKLRALNENEPYYKSYSRWIGGDKTVEYLDYEEDEDEDDEDDEEIFDLDDDEPNSLRWTNPQKWKQMLQK